MRRLRPTKVEAATDDINLSPLIDMTFLLLIFFMVSTSFAKDTKVDIDRPEASQAESADESALRVLIDRGGQVFVDTSPVRSWMVEGRVRELMQQTGRSSVLVVVDEGAPSGMLVKVVDQCRAAGADDVGVAVDKVDS